MSRKNKKKKFFSKARALTKQKDKKKLITFYVLSLPSQVFDEVLTKNMRSLKALLESGLLACVDEDLYVVDVHFSPDPTFYDSMPSPINSRVDVECTFTGISVAVLQEEAGDIIHRYCRRIWKRSHKHSSMKKGGLILRIAFGALESSNFSFSTTY